MSEQNETPIKKKKGGKIAAIIIVVAVIAALVGVILYLLLARKEPEEEPERRSVVVNTENLDDVLAEMEAAEPVEQGYYTVTMSTTWHFANGSAASEDAYVENKEENRNDVYFDVFLDEDRENPIYQSPVIPLGSYIENFALDTPLDAGTYECVCVYHLVDENQDTISTLRVALTIVVEG